MSWHSSRWASSSLALAFVTLAPVWAQLPNLSQNPRDIRNSTVVQVVKRVGPAVVNVSTETVVRNPYADEMPDVFEWFFGQQPRGRQQVQNSLGSGVIVDDEGYVLTNNHVIARASKITVTFSDGRQVAAKVVGADGVSDLAVLKLQGKGPWPAVRMGSSNDLMIGELAIAIGNPFGLQSTVTAGVISAVGRSLDSPEDGDVHYTDFIQTDAAINPGNSGGALINALGELIGVNSAIVAKGQNLGFAIPIDRARAVFQELVRFGRVRPIWTGLRVQELSADDARELGLKLSGGLLVRKVFGGSPASNAAIRVDDVITEVNGVKVRSLADFETGLAKTAVGGIATLRVLREGNESSRSLTLQAFPRERAQTFAWDSLGISVSTNRNLAIIDKVKRESYLGRRGLQPGWALLEFNGKELASANDFYDAVADAVDRRSVSMVIGNNREQYRITVPVK